MPLHMTGRQGGSFRKRSATLPTQTSFCKSFSFMLGRKHWGSTKTTGSMLGLEAGAKTPTLQRPSWRQVELWCWGRERSRTGTLYKQSWGKPRMCPEVVGQK